MHIRELYTPPYNCDNSTFRFRVHRASMRWIINILFLGFFDILWARCWRRPASHTICLIHIFGSACNILNASVATQKFICNLITKFSRWQRPDSSAKTYIKNAHFARLFRLFPMKYLLIYLHISITAWCRCQKYSNVSRIASGSAITASWRWCLIRVDSMVLLHGRRWHWRRWHRRRYRRRIMLDMRWWTRHIRNWLLTRLNGNSGEWCGKWHDKHGIGCVLGAHRTYSWRWLAYGLRNLGNRWKRRCNSRRRPICGDLLGWCTRLNWRGAATQISGGLQCVVMMQIRCGRNGWRWNRLVGSRCDGRRWNRIRNWLSACLTGNRWFLYFWCPHRAR